MKINTYLAWIGTDGDQSLQYAVYSGIALLLLCISAIVYFLWWKVAKRKYSKKNVSKKKAYFIILGLVLFGFFLTFVVPAITREAKYQALQEKCADEVGYGSSADDNSQSATFHSQRQYRKCLESDAR